MTLSAINSVKAERTEDIYDLALMKQNQIPQGLGADYPNVESLISQVMADYQVNSNNIGLAFYDFNNDKHFYINPHTQMVAASTVKVPIVALYLDLINQGVLTLDSPINFSEDYLENGAGEVTNNPMQGSYSLETLIYNAIVYSDNSAWYALMANYSKFGSYKDAILDFINFYQVPNSYYQDNYASAYMAEQWLIKIAENPDYAYLISLMEQTDPRQLFTAYIPHGMANKYGRLEQFVHDTGIYYENGKPQYALVIYTHDLSAPDQFIELLNLRVNEWYRSRYILPQENNIQMAEKKETDNRVTDSLNLDVETKDDNKITIQ